MSTYVQQRNQRQSTMVSYAVWSDDGIVLLRFCLRLVKSSCKSHRRKYRRYSLLIRYTTGTVSKRLSLRKLHIQSVRMSFKDITGRYLLMDRRVQERLSRFLECRKTQSWKGSCRVLLKTFSSRSNLTLTANTSCVSATSKSTTRKSSTSCPKSSKSLSLKTKTLVFTWRIFLRL